MPFKKPRTPGASRPPFVRSPGLPASDFGLPILAPLLDSGTRSSREGAPLNSYPEPSGSPTPHLGGKQTPGPGREQAATPAPLPRALPGEPGAPLTCPRLRRGGCRPTGRRAPLTCRDPPPRQLARAGAAGTRRGRGTSGAVRLPRPPLASPAYRGRRRPRVTLEPPPPEAPPRRPGAPRAAGPGPPRSEEEEIPHNALLWLGSKEKEDVPPQSGRD